MNDSDIPITVSEVPPRRQSSGLSYFRKRTLSGISESSSSTSRVAQSLTKPLKQTMIETWLTNTSTQNDVLEEEDEKQDKLPPWASPRPSANLSFSRRLDSNQPTINEEDEEDNESECSLPPVNEQEEYSVNAPKENMTLTLVLDDEDDLDCLEYTTPPIEALPSGPPSAELYATPRLDFSPQAYSPHPAPMSYFDKIYNAKIQDADATQPYNANDNSQASTQPYNYNDDSQATQPYNSNDDSQATQLIFNDSLATQPYNPNDDSQATQLIINGSLATQSYNINDDSQATQPYNPNDDSQATQLTANDSLVTQPYNPNDEESQATILLSTNGSSSRFIFPCTRNSSNSDTQPSALPNYPSSDSQLSRFPYDLNENNTSDLASENAVEKNNESTDESPFVSPLGRESPSNITVETRSPAYLVAAAGADEVQEFSPSPPPTTTAVILSQHVTHDPVEDFPLSPPSQPVYEDPVESFEDEIESATIKKQRLNRTTCNSQQQGTATLLRPVTKQVRRSTLKTTTPLDRLFRHPSSAGAAADEEELDIGRDSETPSILYSSNDDIKKDRTKSQPTTASKSGLPQRRPRIGLSRNR